MSNWKDSKNKAKDIFDCIRNFALSGAVFFIGIHMLFKAPSSVFSSYLNNATGVLMVALSIFLFVVNVTWFNKAVREEYKAGNINTAFYLIVPALIYMAGVNLFVQTAFSIKANDGKTVGELSAKDLQKSTNEMSNEKR